MTIIDYGLSSEAWTNVVPLIERMIEQRGFRRVIEIGGGKTRLYRWILSRVMAWTMRCWTSPRRSWTRRPRVM